MSAKVSKDERSRQTEYRELCRRAWLPLHFQPWWLDAVCGGAEHWGVCVAHDGGGGVTGVLPWFRRHHWGLPVVQLPPFTSYAGPWFFYPQNIDFKVISRLSFEKKVCSELIAQLPRTVFFRQNFRPEIANWLPFYWAGFRQTTRYTYLVGPGAADRSAWENTLRTDLKKAGARVRVGLENVEPGLLLGLYNDSLRHQNLPASPHDAAFFRLFEALKVRNQSACFIARDIRNDAPHASLLLAYDERQAALLLTGTNALGRQSAATAALIVAALEFCRERGLMFDFEGSMHEGLERVFRAFGGKLTAYFQVWKWMFFSPQRR